MDNNYNNDNSQNDSSFNQQGNYQQQNYQPQGGYYQPQNGNNDGQSKATVSLVLGICSIVTCCCYGIVGIICGVLAIIFAKQSTEMNGGIELSNAKAGRICGIVGLVLGSLYIIYLIVCLVIGIGAGIFDATSYL